MSFVSVTPPRYDCDIFNEISNAKKDTNLKDYSTVTDTDPKNVEYDDLYLVMGLSKGTLVFISVDNLEQVYARFSIHRQQIDQIYEVPKYGKIISVCHELVLNIWGFANGVAHVYKSFPILRPLIDIKVAGQLILFGFKTGDSEMFLWEE